MTTSSESRPIYETKDDRVREQFVADAVAAHFKVGLSRATELSTYDYRMLNGGAPFAALEVKFRYGYNWTQLRFMNTYMLSVEKWLNLWKICGEKRWALCIAVSDKHGEIWASTWRGSPPIYDVRNGGRRDRNDKKDIESVVHIPMDEFNIAIRDRDNEKEKDQ